jgi:hypothetical protein
MALGSIQSLTEAGTKNPPGVEGNCCMRLACVPQLS